MSNDQQPPAPLGLAQPPYQLLERLAAGVLIAVIVALGWMVLVAFQPDLLRLRSPHGETLVGGEVLLVVTLLVAALALVSLLALLHTRPPREAIPPQ